MDERRVPPVGITDQDRHSERDERCHDAVVESALDVQGPPDSAGHQSVRDDPRTQSCVGWRQARSGQHREPNAEWPEDEPGSQRTRDNGQGEPDPEQPGGQANVSAE